MALKGPPAVDCTLGLRAWNERYQRWECSTCDKPMRTPQAMRMHERAAAKVKLPAFQAACWNWLSESDPTVRTKTFQSIIDSALNTIFILAKPSKLCEEFEIAESTVLRWADGTAKPHPLIQKQVVENLLLRAKHE